MFRKTLLVVTAFGVAALFACAGPVGKGQGDSCSTADDCSAGLVCQPVNDAGPYCCPTPPGSSTAAVCKAGGDGG
jgi:hypothetical protein